MRAAPPSEPRGIWHGTALAELDKPGEHLWVLMGALIVADPERPLAAPPLGGELDGPGCFKCELIYSRRLARKPCTGSLS